MNARKCNRKLSAFRTMRFWIREWSSAFSPSRVFKDTKSSTNCFSTVCVSCDTRVKSMSIKIITTRSPFPPFNNTPRSTTPRIAAMTPRKVTEKNLVSVQSAGRIILREVDVSAFERAKGLVGEIFNQGDSAEVIRRVPKRKKKLPSVLTRINPCNKEEEKARFFSDPGYCPQFEYVSTIPRKLVRQYHKATSDKYLKNAIYILDKVVKDFGGYKKYEQMRGGRVLTQDEVADSVQQYLCEQGLENDLQLRFVAGTVSSASVSGNKLTIRIPVTHREHLLRGTLDHEAGTHFFRSMNDKNQVWGGKQSRRKKLGLKHHLKTEEGLACLNTHLFCKSKLLWHAALRYYTAYKAQTMSFRELFDDLQKYVDCENMRWEACLRCKRGFADTEKNGSFSKDQAYLAGAIEILQQRKKIDWTALYAGKMALEDVEKFRNVLKLDDVRLPSFLSNYRVYMRYLDTIAKENDIKAAN